MVDFRYNTVQDDSPEMLEVAAAGYEAVAAGKHHFSIALKTTLQEAEPLEEYRDAAEALLSEKCGEWSKTR